MNAQEWEALAKQADEDQERAVSNLLESARIYTKAVENCAKVAAMYRAVAAAESEGRG